MADKDAKEITVEVAYALPEEQVILEATVPEGATVADAITASGMVERFPQIGMDVARVGIFGRLAGLDAVLRSRDRVEIYRPLIADPREARKRSKERKKEG